MGSMQLFVRMVRCRIYSMFKTGAEQASGGSDVSCRGTNRGSNDFSADRTSWDLILLSPITRQVLAMSAGSYHLSPITFSYAVHEHRPP